MMHTERRRKARARYSSATPLMNRVLSMPDYLYWERVIIVSRPKWRKSMSFLFIIPIIPIIEFCSGNSEI
jgi:hypothetical protein